MTDKTTEQKASRRLKNFDFSEDGAHIALVHKDQGGAANGYATLVMKATNNYSQEFIKKATQVQVTLTFEEFLSKFFDMWYTDAKVLATLLGMQDDEPENDDDDWYKNRIAEQVDKFEILKAAHEADSKPEFLVSLDEDSHLSLLLNQEKFEKALAPKAKASGGKKPKTKPAATQNTVKKADTATAEHKEDTKSMPDSAQPELIAKATLDEVQVQLDIQKAEAIKAKEDLQKALDQLKVFKAREAEAIAKQRKEDLISAVDAEDHAETLHKALGSLDADAFGNVLSVLKSLKDQADANGLFTEQGSPDEGEQVKKSALQSQLSALVNKQAKA